jgi:hypothetical protein
LLTKNEFRVGYKSPCSLVELIEINVNSKEECNFFEGSIEKEEVGEI